VREPAVAPEPPELERIAAETAGEAALVVAAAYGYADPVGRKSSPTDVVTETDLRAEDIVRYALRERTPAAGFLGEEGSRTGQDARLQWVVDPLDGTINFLYGVPLFAVSVAAALDGDVVAGAVVDVLHGEVFSEARDLRCFGSAALELCWVACARVDAYYQRDTEIWDRAAGALIAEEAGARVELPCPENDDLVIAAGAGVFEELWDAVQLAAA
jgi:myo-inositol-1(or 4)-monophosphatase